MTFNLHYLSATALPRPLAVLQGEGGKGGKGGEERGRREDWTPRIYLNDATVRSLFQVFLNFTFKAT